jgi:hypothetical protein
LRDDNVVDWLVALAEAREADFDNHVVIFKPLMLGTELGAKEKTVEGEEKD